MDYEEYFDSLIEKDLYSEKDEIIRILKDNPDNESIKNYGIEDLIFEFLLALNEKDDYASIVRLENILAEHYPNTHEEEFGQFADILIPYYVSIRQESKAKSIFDKWIEIGYDYDSILITLNRLVHYGKESWIEEYIEKEYFNIKTSPNLISGAEEDLHFYKLMIEIGKINTGVKSIDEASEELGKYDLEISERYQKILEGLDQGLNFKNDRGDYILGIVNDFQNYLNSKYDVPYLESGIVMKALTDYFENSKYSDLVTYFKIRENSFERHMYENSINGMSLNTESNYCMLYYLPVFHRFLTEKKIFTEDDFEKEGEKISSITRKFRKEYPEKAWILDKLKSNK